MTTYDVTVTREDGLWVAVVQDLRLGATDMPRFADLDVEVRDLISGLTDTDPDDFGIRWHYNLGDPDLDKLLPAFQMEERRLHEALQGRDEVRQELVHRLLEAGLSQRTVGDVVGLSHQRVHQLVNS